MRKQLNYKRGSTSAGLVSWLKEIQYASGGCEEQSVNLTFFEPRYGNIKVGNSSNLDYHVTTKKVVDELKNLLNVQFKDRGRVDAFCTPFIFSAYSDELDILEVYTR